MPTVAVTGGTGLVGQAVIGELLNRGYDVVSLVRADRAASASPAGSPGCSTRSVAAGDLNDPNYGAVLPPDVATVVHCAARVHVMRDRAANPITEFRRANVDATLSLARHAARQGVERFVYLSSIKVNGEQTPVGHPFRGDGKPSPQDAYSMSKLEAEASLRALSHETELAVTIIRPALVYGPGVKGNFALLARLIRSGLPVPLGGIIGNRRSFVGVGNLADLVVRCASHPGAINETFLASDGDDLSTARLLRLMADAMGCNARLLPVSPRFIRLIARMAGRPEIAERLCGSLQVDITTTREKLDWIPPFSVESGLAAAFNTDTSTDR